MERKLTGNVVLKHIRCAEGDIAPYVITPGDPGRVKRIVQLMDSADLLAENREYIVYTGIYKGVPLTVCSSGIGGPAASIAFEELIKLGAKVFIRVGSAGGRQKTIPIGTPVVITATYRGEGTSKAYLPPEFPAVADLDVTNALVDSLRAAAVPYRAGIGFCRDAYYIQDQQLNTLLTASGVLAAEQEAATLFIVGSYRGVKTGAVVSTDSNIWLEEQPTIEEKEQLYRQGEKLVIQAALDAVVRLHDNGAHVF
ncbi:MAG TPA: purine phosphorylase [Sphaerochaeta sp.]|nr:MAG: purine phosphorylase [Spirochaetes bacterium GWF2_52_7]PKL10914.1 MAG: purine phosphorylase [Spirochaetae bacterium HGW-Spirochaetae-8]PKL21236.1 MAG: purine phosphorylase [Spirochaetae bacterium HGW-Spirochaetae-4]HCJ95234.1 purine phosphorylase [Sphaerochaeta sp.]HCS36574.1 purine phosphorylase [Sphaerochaeta sp.]